MEWLLPQLLALSDEIVRISKEEVTTDERQDPDGHVDQKAPAPIVGVRYPTAQGRTDDMGAISTAEPNIVMATPCLSRGKASSEYPLTAGLQTAARETLDDAWNSRTGSADAETGPGPRSAQQRTGEGEVTVIDVVRGRSCTIWRRASQLVRRRSAGCSALASKVLVITHLASSAA